MSPPGVLCEWNSQKETTRIPLPQRSSSLLQYISVTPSPNTAMFKMKFPWQKEPSRAQNLTAPSTASFPEKSIEAQEPQDGERRIIPVTEDEKSSSRTSLDRPQAVEHDVGSTDLSRTTGEKEAETDLVPSASRATEASSVGEAGEDDESKYPTAFPLAILTFGLCLSTFVVALDNTIIGTLHALNPFPSEADHVQRLLYRELRPSSIH